MRTTITGPQCVLSFTFYLKMPMTDLNDEGVGVGSDGMIFTCYPRGNETYTLGLVTGPTTEEAWPE